MSETRIPGHQSESHEPLALEFYVGGFGGASYGAWWTGTHVVYESFASNYESLEQLRVTPSTAQWKRFWLTVDELTVWDWASRYEPAERFEPSTVVRDGVHWSLTLEHAGRRIESSGDSAGPGAKDLDESSDFRGLLDAFSRLLGGCPFC